MPLLTDKLAAPTLRQQLATHIRNSVLRGALLPGEKIVERDLAAHFGTSLTVVREAIIQLETEGLIVKRPNASTAVVQLSAQDVLDIFAVRRELERYAVTEAARRITRPEFQMLEILHLDAVAIATSGDAEAYVQADLAWHQALWSVTKNAFLETALQSVVTRLFGFSYIQLASLPGFDLIEDAHSHRLVLDALQRNNAEAAAAAFALAVDTWMDYALAIGDSVDISWQSSEKFLMTEKLETPPFFTSEDERHL